MEFHKRFLNFKIEWFISYDNYKDEISAVYKGTHKFCVE